MLKNARHFRQSQESRECLCSLLVTNRRARVSWCNVVIIIIFFIVASCSSFTRYHYRNCVNVCPSLRCRWMIRLHVSSHHIDSFDTGRQYLPIETTRAYHMHDQFTPTPQFYDIWLSILIRIIFARSAFITLLDTQLLAIASVHCTVGPR